MGRVRRKDCGGHWKQRFTEQADFGGRPHRNGEKGSLGWTGLDVLADLRAGVGAQESKYP